MSSERLPTTAKPVTIISGFLGAGKTSFLNEYLAFQKDRKPIIIENEFGKEGIDAGLIIAPDAGVFELNSGCLCCNLNEDLFDLLGVLWEKNQDFDELLIETTGIADPAAVAQPFMISAEIERYYKLERVICLVDARLIRFELEETQEARKQIAFADIIVINKCDMVATENIGALEELLRNINPFATIFSGSKNTGYPLKEIMALNRADFDSRLATYPQQSSADQADKSTYDQKEPAVKEHHHQGISSLSFVFERPFNLELFEHRLLMFLNFQAKDIYRVKGFVWVSGSNDKIIVQSVSNLLGITSGPEWPAEELRRSRIVFIGRDLKSKGLKDMLEQCLDGLYTLQ